METGEILDRLSEAVQLNSDDAAVRVQGVYEPQAGEVAKVFPPTYIPGSDGIRYHYEQRWSDNGEPVDVVILDSIQSQANRAERALRTNADALDIPQIVIEATVGGRTVSVSNLDAPHRSRDAYFLDAESDGVPFDKTEVGKALNEASVDDATAFLRYSPYDLVYGVWDSHRGKRIPTKFPRVVTSEMVGWHVLPGKKAATKGDPLNLKSTMKVPLDDWRPDVDSTKKDAEQKLSELGHGMVPVAPDESAGGVSVRSITRDAVISLTGLARLQFAPNVTVAGRVALAAMALVADRLAFGGAGLHLRSGTDLVVVSDTLEWVRRGGGTERFNLDVPAAKDLFSEAHKRLAAVGVEWTSNRTVLQPTARLMAVIEATFSAVDLDEE